MTLPKLRASTESSRYSIAVRCTGAAARVTTRLATCARSGGFAFQPPRSAGKWPVCSWRWCSGCRLRHFVARCGHFRRRAERQRDDESCSTARTAFRTDFSAMGFDDGAADGQPQADTGRGGFTLAAREFFEYRLFRTRHEPWAVVGHDDAEPVAAHRALDADLAAFRRVLGGILEKIDQNPLEQYGVDFHQRQVGGQVDAQRVRSQQLPERGDG